MKQPEISGR